MNTSLVAGSDEWKECARRELLDARLEIGIEDGRTFTGVMKCLDCKMNVLLVDCVETCKQGGREVLTKIGIVNIPGALIKTARLH